MTISLSAFLHVYVPAYLFACLSTCLHYYLPVCVPAYLSACLLTCLPTCLHSCLPACVPAYLTACLCSSLSAGLSVCLSYYLKPIYLCMCTRTWMPVCFPTCPSGSRKLFVFHQLSLGLCICVVSFSLYICLVLTYYLSVYLHFSVDLCIHLYVSTESVLLPLLLISVCVLYLRNPCRKGVPDQFIYLFCIHR